MHIRHLSQPYRPVSPQSRQKPHTFKQFRASGFLIGISMLSIFLTSCSPVLVNTTSQATPSATRPPVVLAPTATPDALSRAQTRVAQIMAGMSLDQKLGQLLIVEYLGNDQQNSGLQYMVSQQYVGGLLYQFVNHNFDAPDNTIASLAAFSRQTQQEAEIPLVIGTDQEGGQVNRLQTFHGPLPSAQTMAESGSPQYVYDQGAQAAKWLAQLGINTDLAPVVDVQTVNPPILQDRMFGSTPQAVETYAGAFLNGLQKNGIVGTLKHFPGLGAISSDPHAGLPTVNRSLSELNDIDLAPYKTLIAQDNPAMVMATDVLMPAIDPTLPAELSPKAIDGLLRGTLGYQGVVITDGLYMDGISDTWTLSQAAVLAVIAGVDLVEGEYTVSQVAAVVTGLKQALQSGSLTMARVNQSVERILLMKVERGIIK
jgi:beta-N-acetylhexosaminidase